MQCSLLGASWFDILKKLIKSTRAYLVAVRSIGATQYPKDDLRSLEDIVFQSSCQRLCKKIIYYLITPKYAHIKRGCYKKNYSRFHTGLITFINICLVVIETHGHKNTKNNRQRNNTYNQEETKNRLN